MAGMTDTSELDELCEEFRQLRERGRGLKYESGMVRQRTTEVRERLAKAIRASTLSNTDIAARTGYDRDTVRKIREGVEPG